MRLETNTHTTEMGGMKQDPSTFKIQNSAAAFKILSSGLYSDKITAVIREIVCNAFDIHVSTGQKNPFKIHLPTSLEPYFSVQDFGTGLAPEDMEELYVTYFASTKSDDDSSIGGFGLGCKSPFAYCSAFNVTSVFDGYEYTYSLMLNDDGMPAIVLMDEQPTQDHSGLTVSIPVKTNDIYEFHTKAERVLEFFKDSFSINLSDFKARQVKHTHKGEDWAIRELNSSVGNSPRAIVGNVAYRFESLSLTGLSIEQSLVLRLPIDLFFNVGDLSVTPSRETLEMTKRTVANLCGRLQVIYDQVVLSLKDEIEKAPSLWKAKILLRERMDSSNPFSPIIKSVIKSYFTQYPGFTMDEVSTTLDMRKFSSFDVYCRSWETKRYTTDKIGKLTNCLNSYGKVYFETSDRVRFYVKDSTENLGRLSKRILEEAKDNGEEIYLYILVPTSGSDKKVSKEFDAMVKALGDPDVSFTSDLPALPRKPRGYRAPSDTVSYCWKATVGWHNSLSRNDWTKAKGEDLTGDGPFFYLPLDNLELQTSTYGSVFAKAWASLSRTNQTCEFEDGDYAFGDLTLFGLNAKGREKVKEDSRWINFETFLKDYFIELPQDFISWKSLKSLANNNQLNQNIMPDGNYIFKHYVEGLTASAKRETSSYSKWIYTFREKVRGTDFHKQAVIARRLQILITRALSEKDDYMYLSAILDVTKQKVDLETSLPSNIKNLKDAFHPELLDKYTMLRYISFDWETRRSEDFGLEIGSYVASV